MREDRSIQSILHKEDFIMEQEKATTEGYWNTSILDKDGNVLYENIAHIDFDFNKEPSPVFGKGYDMSGIKGEVQLHENIPEEMLGDVKANKGNV